jgi:hypothetical protein
MFDLSQSDKNKVVILDSRSGSEIELYYRTPTTEEEVAYQSKLFRRAGKKVVLDGFTRLEYGLKVITGFREGDFCVGDQKISSDRESPSYREDWKALLKDKAAGIVIAFAVAIFEGTGSKEKDEDEEEIPFQKS